MNWNISYLQGEEFSSKQLMALQELEPDLFSNYRARATIGMHQGSKYLNQLIEEEFSSELLAEVLAYKDVGANFEFLHHILYASFFAGARAQNVEASFFGKRTARVAKLGMLMSLFTNLFDGVLDEAPEIMDCRDLRFLGEQLRDQPWEKSRVAPTLSQSPDRHPVVTLLLQVMCTVIKYIINAPAWTKSRHIRKEFALATELSFKAEKGSTQYIIGSYWPSDINFLAGKLEAKSVAPAWIGLLFPICYHGWPDNVDAAGIKTLSVQLGALGGWLDDISDLHEDLEKKVWSNVLLEIYHLTHKGVKDRNSAIGMLKWSLTEPSIIRHIVTIGVEKYSKSMMYVDALNLLDPGPLKQSMADKTTIFLSRDFVDIDQATF
jgi:hypothetical protein